MSRARNKQPVTVEHADLETPRWKQHRERQRIREAFLEREAARGRPSKRAETTEVVRPRGPMMQPSASIVKELICKGFSQETAERMAATLLAEGDLRMAMFRAGRM
jgi:hypothetical protein